MNIGEVIQNLKTFLEGLSWVSLDGSGNTTFFAVLTYPCWGNQEGFPVAIILDESSSAEGKTNRHTEINTNVGVYVCVNFSVIEKSSEDAKMEEAYLRLREAYDILKVELLKETTRQTLGADYTFDGSFEDSIVGEFNLLRRRINIQVKELVERF